LADLRQLGHLEAGVMDRLWSWDRPVLVREVLEDLHQDRHIAYTTVMTVMDNLYRKGFLAREMDGRAYRYWPARSREEHGATLMQQALAATDDRAATLLYFLERIAPNDLVGLQDALRQRPSGPPEQPG
jgi:predicted transcriptional regulator